MCTAVLIDSPTPNPPPHLSSYTRVLLASQDRRHLFVTSCPPIHPAPSYDIIHPTPSVHPRTHTAPPLPKLPHPPKAPHPLPYPSPTASHPYQKLSIALPSCCMQMSPHWIFAKSIINGTQTLPSPPPPLSPPPETHTSLPLQSSHMKQEKLKKSKLVR